MLIQFFHGHSFVLCFDFLNLFCRSGDYPQTLVADFVKQTVKLSALRGFACYLFGKKNVSTDISKRVTSS